MNKKYILFSIFCLLAIFILKDYFYSTQDFGPYSPDKKKDLSILESPRPGQKISSPLIVRGRARGFWFFEASFPLSVLHEDGRVLASGIATAMEEWMTTEFVPFEAELTFSEPVSGSGFLILNKDNPSGLPEFESLKFARI